MKPMVLILSLLMFGCSSLPKAADTPTTSSFEADLNALADKLASGKLMTFAHEDLLNAAKYATDNGYPARAAVYMALDAQRTAVANQIIACKSAIAAALPSSPPSGTVGAFTLYEIAAERVGQGIPASVRINCGAIVLP